MSTSEMIEIDGKLCPHDRDMTPEEEAAIESARQEVPVPAPTTEERLAMMGGGLDV